MNDLLFYAILLGLLISAGAIYCVVTEFKPIHRDNRNFAGHLQDMKERLANAKQFVAAGKESGLIKK